MAGIILAGLNSNTEINLVTSKGSKINNYQLFELSAFEKGQFPNFEKFTFVQFRCSPSPVYNCHGMTFASRRTNVYDSNDIRTIIREDGYKVIEISKTMPGDIVLYVETATGDISHSGTVILAEHQPDQLMQIKIVSKWGKFKEVIHHLNNSPYIDCVHEFYRISHEEYEI